jgi:transposase
VHKSYTLATAQSADGRETRDVRVQHERGLLAQFLAGCTPGSAVAVETVGNWYWIVDEIEQAGFQPLLVHARKAKLMIGSVNKTDKLDNRGIIRLQRVGTLPTVWIAPAEVRDLRELPRTRMMLTGQRAQLKNRILANLAKYGLTIYEASDSFGKKGRQLLEARLSQLPAHTRHTTECLLTQLDGLTGEIGRLEARMREAIEVTSEHQLLMSLPGVGRILAAVIATEVGTIKRFPRAEQFASYAGVTPRVHSSGGKTRFGSLRPDVNRYLKFAFIEAANTVALNSTRRPERHVSHLYVRIRHKKGHAKAVGAVARHLAEAAFWMLTKNQPYKEPAFAHEGSSAASS